MGATAGAFMTCVVQKGITLLPVPGTQHAAALVPRPFILLPQAVLQAGVGYAFVVDGVNGASGQFSIRCACVALPN